MVAQQHLALNTCWFFFIWTIRSLKSKFVLTLKSQQVSPVALHLPHANVWTRLERKLKSISSLKLKKLSSRVNDLKIISILQNEILLLMLFCERVLKQREDNETEKLFPDPFLINQNRVYVWINGLQILCSWFSLYANLRANKL